MRFAASIMASSSLGREPTSHTTGTADPLSALTGRRRRLPASATAHAAFALLVFLTGEIGFCQERRGFACSSVSLFDMCDPYVPGVIITATSGYLRVGSTWPSGPAEVAGVCPGDRIVAVNGVALSKMSGDEAIKTIVSPTPGPVTLTVDRSGQRLDFRVNRMRESGLVALSHEKYLHWQQIDDERPQAVPITETAEEMAVLETALQERVRRSGYRWSHSMLVPANTPEAQVARLAGLTSGAAASARFQGHTDLYPETGKFGPGLSLLVLKAPPEIVVHMVLPSSPAFRAGILPGDNVAEIDGHSVAGGTAEQLATLLERSNKNDQISILVKRGATEVLLRMGVQDRASLMENPDPYADIPRRPGGITASHDFVDLGLKVLYDSGPRRVVVDEVLYPSPAFDAGLELGDELIAVNGKPVGELTEAQVSDLLAPSGLAALNLTVARLGKRLTLEIKPELWSQALARIGRRLTEHGPVPRNCP